MPESADQLIIPVGEEVVDKKRRSRPLIVLDAGINLGNGREAHLSFPRRRKPPVVAVPAIRNRAS